MKKLLVHSSKRYLMYDNGEPFYYLGDTAWNIFHRLNREEAVFYMDTRKEQEFNVIQAVCLSEHDGLRTPNAYGCFPLKKNDAGEYDPCQPDLDGDYSYWDHIDYVINLAAERDMFVALLPTWGDKFNKSWGVGPEIFTPENAYEYGKWIGNRYKNQWNIIWILGGDRPLETIEHKLVIDEMARGIKEAEGENNHLFTLHTTGELSSVEYVKHRDYIDFHTIQSGHSSGGYYSYDILSYTERVENKPFMDAEPRYEDHPSYFKPELKYYWNADDVRQNLYWNILEGACGNTYGNHCIWSFNKEPEDYFPFKWSDAINHVGANQVKYAMKLRLSRPYFEFRKCTELIAEDNTAVMGHIASGRGENYAYIYSPQGLPFKVNAGIFRNGDVVRASWFNPRTGEEAIFGVFPKKTIQFVPEYCGKGNDWILILDAVSIQ